MTGTLQPLDQKFAIVGSDGKPTEYFTRWAQQRQIDIGNSIELSDVQAYLTAHKLVAGTGIQLTPDGDINNGVNIHADAQAILDEVTATRGAIIYRGLLGWAALLPDTAGKVLQTNGAGADPTWVTPSGGGGGGGSWPAATVPGQIGGLVGWWDASLLAAPAGAIVACLNSPDPLRVVSPASKLTSTITVGATPLNTKNVATFPTASTGNLTLQTSLQLNTSTVFVVHRPGTMSVGGRSYSFLGGPSGAYLLRLTQSAANVANLQLVKDFVASIGLSTGTVTTGTAYQANVTYSDATGAYAFRIAKAAAGSGTNAQGISSPTTVIGTDGAGSGAELNGDLAELIVYSRILTPAEIAAVEAYLTAKWGV